MSETTRGKAKFNGPRTGGSGGGAGRVAGGVGAISTSSQMHDHLGRPSVGNRKQRGSAVHVPWRHDDLPSGTNAALKTCGDLLGKALTPEHGGHTKRGMQKEQGRHSSPRRRRPLDPTPLCYSTALSLASPPNVCVCRAEREKRALEQRVHRLETALRCQGIPSPRHVHALVPGAVADETGFDAERLEISPQL